MTMDVELPIRFPTRGVLGHAVRSLRQSLTSTAASSLPQLALGEEAVVVALDLPEGASQRLQELGFVPGSRVVAAWSAPGGDPRVYRVDGAEVALRRETAAHVRVRSVSEASDAA